MHWRDRDTTRLRFDASWFDFVLVELLWFWLEWEWRPTGSVSLLVCADSGPDRYKPGADWSRGRGLRGGGGPPTPPSSTDTRLPTPARSTTDVCDERRPRGRPYETRSGAKFRTATCPAVCTTVLRLVCPLSLCTRLRLKKKKKKTQLKLPLFHVSYTYPGTVCV